MLAHLVAVLGTALLIVAPLPWIVLALRSERGPVRVSVALLAGLTLWCFLQSAVALVLGASGLFVAAPLWLYEVSMAVGGLLVLRDRSGGLLCPAVARIRLGVTARFGVAVVVGVLLFALLEALRRPFWEYDTLAYHLPTMMNWIRHGSFVLFDQFAADQIGLYPYGWEALCALFLLVGRGDLFGALPNFAALAILLLGVYATATELGAGRVHALAGCAALAAMPHLLEATDRIQTDMPLAAFFVAALYWILCGAGRYPALAWLALPASAALLVGVKTSGLIYTGLLVVVALVRGWALLSGTGSNTPKRVPKPSIWVVAWIGLALFVGGYWYARTYVLTGNPLGLLHVDVLGVTILPGNEAFTARTPRTTLGALFDLGNEEHWRILLEQVYTQFGAALVGLAAQLVIALGVLVVRGRALRSTSWVALAPALLLPITVVVYWYTPYSASNGPVLGYHITPWIGSAMRYGFSAIALFGLVSVLAAGRAGLPEWVAWGVTGAAVAGLASARGSALPVVTVAGMVGVVWGWDALRERFGQRPWGWGVAVVLVAAVLITYPMREARLARAAEVDRYGPVYPYLAELPPGTRIAYVYSHRSHLLFGPRIEHDVFYVPAAPDESFDAWLERLRGMDVTYLAMGPLLPPWQEKPEPAWIRSALEWFEPVVGSNPDVEVVLYRVRQGGKTAFTQSTQRTQRTAKD